MYMFCSYLLILFDLDVSHIVYLTTRVQQRQGILPRELKDTRNDPVRIQEYKGECNRERREVGEDPVRQ